MKRPTIALSCLLLLPLTGCVFAVGTDDEEAEALRDRVRALERRVERIETPTHTVIIQGQTVPAVVEPVKAEPQKEPK